MPNTSTHRGLKEYLRFIGPGTIIMLAGFIIAYQFVAPAPPRHCYRMTWPHIWMNIFTRLNRIEVQVSQTSVPLSFSNELYHLRLHIEMLRNKLVQAASDSGSSDDFQ